MSADRKPTAGALLSAYRQAMIEIRDGRATAGGMTAAEYARLFLEISPEGVDEVIERERRVLELLPELRAGIDDDTIREHRIDVATGVPSTLPGCPIVVTASGEFGRPCALPWGHRGDHDPDAAEAGSCIAPTPAPAPAPAKLADNAAVWNVVQLAFGRHALAFAGRRAYFHVRKAFADEVLAELDAIGVAPPR